MPIHRRSISHPMNPLQNRCRAGFSLVELLIVISILFMLIGMLLPGLSFAREQARRIGCASNQRQLYLGAQNWSTDHKGRLPITDRQTTDLAKYTKETDHISWVSETFFKLFEEQSGMELHEFTCPNRGPEFVKFESNNPVRYRIGYYIMWGRDTTKWNHVYTPWVSPQHMFHPSPMSMAVTGDIIESGTANPPSSSASHTHSGGTGFGPKNGLPSQMGADGGNNGYLDGSVFWVPLLEMERHSATSSGGISGWW